MILIVGGDSAIGKELSKFWQNRGVDHHSSTRRKTEIADWRPYIDLQKNNWRMKLDNYESTVICAAVSRLSDCENDPEGSRQINVVNTVKLGQKLIQNGVFVLLLSTNAVFDGTKPFRKTTEPVCPTSEYGRQKADAEQELLGSGMVAVLRLTKVINEDFPLFKKWKFELQNGRKIFPFSNVYFSPVGMDEVVKKIDQLLSTREPGIYHLSSATEMTYAEYSMYLCKHWGYDENLIEPVPCNPNSIPNIHNSLNVL